MAIDTWRPANTHARVHLLWSGQPGIALGPDTPLSPVVDFRIHDGGVLQVWYDHPGYRGPQSEFFGPGAWWSATWVPDDEMSPAPASPS